MFETNSWSPARRRAVVGSLALLFVAANATVFALARRSDRQSINASGAGIEVRGTTTVPGATTFTTIALQTLATTVTLVPLEEGDSDTALPAPVTETQPPATPVAAPTTVGPATTARSTTTTRPTTTTTRPTTTATTAPPPPPAPTVVPLPTVTFTVPTWSVTLPPTTDPPTTPTTRPSTTSSSTTSTTGTSTDPDDRKSSIVQQ